MLQGLRERLVRAHGLPASDVAVIGADRELADLFEGAVATGAAAAQASLDTNAHRSMNSDTRRTIVVISGASSLEPSADELPPCASTASLSYDRLHLLQLLVHQGQIVAVDLHHHLAADAGD